MDASPSPPAAPSDDEVGPVTKLAALAAQREEQDRAARRQAAHAELEARASLVGSTALALAAAAKAGSPVRLSPQQQGSLKALKVPGDRAPPRMSVAARARAAADVPSSQRRQQQRPQSAEGGAIGNGNGSHADGKNSGGGARVAPAPNSGTGIMRGKFSKAQVKEMIDEWGREDTSEDEYDDYYEGEADEGSGGDYYGNREHYKQTLQGHHHLQYSMSDSPGKRGEEHQQPQLRDDEFHYQHHRVSAYRTSRRTNNAAAGGTSRPNIREGEESSGGLFASAKHWLQGQREKLHQLELERQVEEQRRRLVEEGRKQRALEAERRRHAAMEAAAQNHDRHAPSPPPRQKEAPASPSRTQGLVAPSSSFGCIEGVAGVADPDLSMEAQEDQCNLPEQTAIVSGMPSSLCGFGGLYEQQLDDSTDYDGVARVDSEGNILEMIPSGSLDEDDAGEMKVRMRVSSPRCTLSGEGMSVKVDLPDTPDNSERAKTTKHARDGSEDSESWVADIKLVPEPPQDDNINASRPILQTSQMRALIASGGLPPSLNFCKWKRIYSLARDGDSFDQFLRLVEGHDRTVLVVKTTKLEVFGGYADTRWEARHFRQSANEFYGSAQACLFKFPGCGVPGGKEDRIAIYKWSGQNRYVQLCDAADRRVAFGGGGDEGDFGLCIEDDFRRGTTGHCSTFENEPLCDGGFFDVLDMELYGFPLDL
ncbi:hypothetical protein ACHAXT_011019 [Thalassiosira profunda]